MIGMNAKPREAGAKRRASFSDRAYAELRRRILENTMPVGAQYMEQELAELLDMSRTPIREALIRLANEGLVEVRPRHGMRVKAISLRDMEEIYAVLTGLESTAAGLAAAMALAADEIDRLGRAVADMDAALAGDHLEAWAEADAHFHRLLVDFSGNARLAALVGTFMDQSHRVRMLTLRLRPRPEASNEDHRAVVDAIARGDADTARSIHRRHREKSGTMLVTLLETHGMTQL